MSLTDLRRAYEKNLNHVLGFNEWSSSVSAWQLENRGLESGMLEQILKINILLKLIPTIIKELKLILKINKALI